MEGPCRLLGLALGVRGTLLGRGDLGFGGASDCLDGLAGRSELQDSLGVAGGLHGWLGGWLRLGRQRSPPISEASSRSLAGHSALLSSSCWARGDSQGLAWSGPLAPAVLLERSLGRWSEAWSSVGFLRLDVALLIQSLSYKNN